MRTRKCILFFLLITIIYYPAADAQVVIRRNGNVFYFDNGPEMQGKIDKLAEHCNKYIDSLQQPGIGCVFLDFHNSRDTFFQLGYDNIHGNSIYNDVYEKNGRDYKMIGIRISIYHNSGSIREAQVLKLLAYGIKHLPELKALRNKAMRKDFYGRPATIILEKRVVEKILLE